MALYKGSIEIAGSSIGGNSSSIDGGSGGGVIDGSKFELVNGDQNDHYKKTVTKTITTTATSTPIVEVYTVENDCGLYINHKNNYLPIRYYLDAEGTSPIFDTYDSNSTSNPQLHGIVIPIKAGTKIYAQSYFKQINNGVEYTFTFIEYKLNSITPQIAMPDWDNSKADTINSGDTITQNGWIVLASTGSVDDDSEYIKVNGVDVTDLYTFSGDESLPGPIPVSKGDVVTYLGNISVTFYPAKTVAQPDCTSYVVESGRESDRGHNGTSYDQSGFKYYRLYSDGWLEQGGRTVINQDGTTADRTITMLKSYKSDKSYMLTLGNICYGEYALSASDLTSNTFTPHYSSDLTTGGVEWFSWKTEGFI